MDDVNVARDWTSIRIDDVRGAARITLLSPTEDVLKVKVFFAGEVFDLLNRLVDLILEEEELLEPLTDGLGDS
jgi:hypothetical protein